MACGCELLEVALALLTSKPADDTARGATTPILINSRGIPRFTFSAECVDLVRIGYLQQLGLSLLLI